MIKLLFVFVLLLSSTLLYFLNAIHPVNGGVPLSILFIAMLVVKIWESFYTSKEKEASKYNGDWTLILTSVLYYFASVLIVIEFYSLNRGLNPIILVIGILVIIFAAIVRRWSIKTLGNQWAIHAIGPSKLLSKHNLVDKGPYKYTRHPIYLSYIFDLIGLALAFNSYYSIIFICIVNVSSYIIRAHHEEAFSVERIGNYYVDYKSKTPFFLPIGRKRK